MNISLSILDPDPHGDASGQAAAPLIDRAMHLSQQLRRYDPALAALLVKAEGKARHTTSSKPKVRNVKIRGGGGKVSKIKLGVTDEDWKRAGG